MTESATKRRAHARLTELFHRALELDSRQRAALYDGLEQEDSALRLELEELVSAHEDRKPTDLLGSPLVAPAGPLASDTGAPGLPEHVGCYRVIECIGSGGMGSVWLAEQEEPIQRRVALKLIRRHLPGEVALARFEYERRLLARMEHPSIAHILDAGSLPDGRPWFAMELVSGEPVDQWCARRQVDLGTCLQLFLEICGAVEHAHRRGIVHLDIKASNVLVREVDGRVETKLIDFGIAHALGGRSRGAEDELRAGRWGSAGTMSPEQAAAGGAQVDVRSDVYSLGLLLHQMLVRDGASTFAEFDGLTFEEVEARLRTAPRPRPSAVLREIGELDGEAMHLGLPRARLLKALERDLDWVVSKATRFDPEERYATVAALAQDVRRFLADEPLSAAPSSRSYRLRKAYRRQRLAFVAAAAILVFLMLGAAMATIGLFAARRERDAAQDAAVRESQARVAAQLESARAQRMTDFLADTLRLADPRVTLDANLSVRALLDITSRRLAGALDPRSEATLHATVGEAYRSLGEDERAREHLGQAVRFLQHTRSESALQLYRPAWSLFLLQEQRDGRRSFELLLPVVYLRADLIQEFHEPLALRMGALLNPVLATEFDLALADLPAAIAEAEGAHPEEHPLWAVVADELTDLAFVLARESGDERAHPLLDQAERLLGRRLPAGHPDLARLVYLRAALWMDGGEFARAEAALRATLELLERALPAGHWRIHEAGSLLGECLFAMGDEAPALARLSTAADGLDAALGRASAPSIDARVRYLDAHALGSRPLEDRRLALAGELAERPFGTGWWRLRPGLLGPPDDVLRSALGDLLRSSGPMAKASDERAGLDLLERLVGLACVGRDAPSPRARLLGRILIERANELSHDHGELRERMARAALTLLDDCAEPLSLHLADARSLIARAELDRGLFEEALRGAEAARLVYERELGARSASTLLADRLCRVSEAKIAARDSGSGEAQVLLPPLDLGGADFLPEPGPPGPR